MNKKRVLNKFVINLLWKFSIVLINDYRDILNLVTYTLSIGNPISFIFFEIEMIECAGSVYHTGMPWCCFSHTIIVSFSDPTTAGKHKEGKDCIERVNKSF